MEYKTLKRRMTDLRLVIQSDLINLSGELFAADLITQQYLDRSGIDAIPEQKRGAELVSFILNKVKEDRGNYHTFFGVLKNMDSTHYGGILHKLQESYDGRQRQVLMYMY